MTDWENSEDSPWYDNQAIKEVIIKDGVTSIDTYAFYKCANLASVEIPDSVETIKDSAFYYCNALTVTITNSATSIGYQVFPANAIIYGVQDSTAQAYAQKNGLKFVAISGTCGDNLTWSIDNEGTLTISGTGAMTDWENSEDSPWNNNKAINKVIIEDGVTSIIDNAFVDCTALTSVKIPDSVETIGQNAFYGCSSMTSFSVSENNSNYSSADGVLFNKDKTKLLVFPQNSSIKNYTVPNSVKSIENSAFCNCSSLKSVTIENPECAIYDDANTVPDTAIIHDYTKSTAKEYAEKYNREFVSVDEIPEETTTTTTTETTTTTTTTTTTLQPQKKPYLQILPQLQQQKQLYLQLIPQPPSLKNLLTALGGLVTTGFGLFALKKSRRKEENQ